ncbi:hypothetical protein LTY36_03355 [Limosilactobacillus agrestis]|uniref:Uncharacterized protein n=1 Tax=Limosilactobacillus agrestis TaxID=2759748 RepID=A0ABS8R642_9LACO|nr:hypothetical protein [Limosilactobacillus agrestis]MBB1098759.1 hypothetical protein [Limosilactobacillus agrestis]MBD5090882.1 hypothetical protein [Lactobacillus sp.]MCD7125724.1 hypothetical protein [Limosilactobacillus agrestis]MCD7130241.1 hypothetical protein [Limosilactobacillus agrestis]
MIKQMKTSSMKLNGSEKNILQKLATQLDENEYKVVRKSLLLNHLNTELFDDYETFLDLLQQTVNVMEHDESAKQEQKIYSKLLAVDDQVNNIMTKNIIYPEKVKKVYNKWEQIIHEFLIPSVMEELENNF